MTSVQTPVSLASKVTQSEDVLIQEVGGEAVLLDLASERYFGLDPVGTRIWALMSEHENLQAIADAMCAEFDADPARIRNDLLALVNDLVVARLVRVQ